MVLGTNQEVGGGDNIALSCGRPRRGLRWTWLNRGISTTHGLALPSASQLPADSHGGGVALQQHRFHRPELGPAMLRNCASSIGLSCWENANSTKPPISAFSRGPMAKFRCSNTSSAYERMLSGVAR